jgi:hypothetical protein
MAGCPGGVCSKKQKKANKKQAKQEAKALAAQPVVSNAPPAIAANQIGSGAAPSSLQGFTGGLPALGGVQQSYNMQPITYTHKGPGFFSSVDPTTQYYPSFTPEQQFSLDQLLRGGLNGIQGLQTPDFGPIEEQAKREFQTQTIPSLAERFTSLGGGQRSSAFQGALGSAASDLQSQLAALRSKYGLAANEQRLQQALPQLQFGLQPRYESVFTPRQPSGISNLFSGISQGIGQGISSLGKIGLGI